jgi:hypothetical protein
VEKWGLSEIAQMKGSVVTLLGCLTQAMLAIDDKNGALFVAARSDVVQIHVDVETAVMCNATSFLIQTPNEGRLKVYQMAGHFRPAFPACAHRCPIMRNRDRWRRDLMNERAEPAVYRRYGLGFLMKMRVALRTSNWTRNQLRLLLDWISGSPQFATKTLTLALMLGDTTRAENILSASNGDSSSFVQNTLRLVFLGFSGTTPKLDCAVSQLMVAGCLNQAMDLMLMTGNWRLAVERLLDNDNILDALVLLKAQPDSHQKAAFLGEIAEKWLDERNWTLAMSLFGEMRDKFVIAAKLRAIKEHDQAAFFMYERI